MHTDGFLAENAVALTSNYDVVVDASDNAPTRYLISDACAATHRPLVSGAAIGTDGQLTVYCHGDNGENGANLIISFSIKHKKMHPLPSSRDTFQHPADVESWRSGVSILEACCSAGPCYRCLFPEAPQPESCARCSEAGVLGPVPGVIGTLQALEAIKILSGKYPICGMRQCRKFCFAASPWDGLGLMPSSMQAWARCSAARCSW